MDVRKRKNWEKRVFEKRSKKRRKPRKREENYEKFQEILDTQEDSIIGMFPKPPQNSPEDSSIPFIDDSPQREYFQDCHYKKRKNRVKVKVKKSYLETHF